MNSTLSPSEAQLAAYYQRGMVAEAHEVQLARRAAANEAHFEAWLEGRSMPDLVRLAEYAATPDARLTPGEIEQHLTRDLERALRRTEGGEMLQPEVRALHGLPDPVPIPAYLEGLAAEELQGRMDRLLDQWSDAVATADYRADVRENGSSVDPNAPLAVVRPDLHPAVAVGLGIGPTRRLTDTEIDALLVGQRADGEKIEGKHYAKERRLPVDPKTGERRISSPIGSYDFCPTPDKSVSVAWAFANPSEQAAIYDAHIQAAREAVTYIAERVGQVRLGNGGADGSEPGHVGWLEFTHHTSRRTQISIENGEVKIAEKGEGVAGDPDLHTHFLIPNAVFAESGKVGSLDSAAIPGFIFEADAYYHARLAQRLSDAGFASELDGETGAARMPVIPDAVRTLFSKRTNMGELLARRMTEDRGEDWDTLSKEQREARVKNATQDRDQKIKGEKDDLANFEDWRRQAREVCGWEAPETLQSEVYTVILPPEIKRHIAYEIALPILDERFQHKAVLQHFEPRIAAARGMIAVGGGDLSDINAITATMREYGVQQYGERTPLIWGIEEGRRYTSVTTGLHEADEKEFVSLARKAATDRSATIPQALLEEKIKQSSMDLSGQHGQKQRQTIERLGSGGRFAVAVGSAGAGKSTMLKPLVAAWQEQGRDVYGVNLATRHADQLTDAGISQHHTMPFVALIDRLKIGELKLTKQSVVAIDEFAMLGTRQGLELLRAQDRLGFSVVALGDDKQIESIAAGAIVNLSRRALGAEQIPEILTTVRQQTERERTIVGLFREGRAAEALDMKRADGTAEMVDGGYDGVVSRVAKLYADRFQATGEPPTIAAPTNQDAHRLSAAVRQERRAMGLIGATDLMTIPATDGERNYTLPLATGDKVRLFASTPARIRGKGAGNIGRNGSILDVVAADKHGITLKSRTGSIGLVAWATLQTKGRAKLAYGDAMTIHTAQGTTSREPILALPSGSSAIDGKLGYSGNTRHRHVSYLLTNEVAEGMDVRKRRALNDAREITISDRWANVARALSYQPEKDTAVALFDRIGSIRRGSAREFQKFIPNASKATEASAQHAPELARRRSIDRALYQARVMIRQVVDHVRQVPAHVAARITRRHEHTRHHGRSLGR